MGFLWTSVVVVLTAMIVMQLPQWLKGRPPVVGGPGTLADGWEKVANTFKSHLDSGLEEGGAFAVYHKGELVVEYYGGYADEDASVPWDKETLTQIYSSSKMLGALCIALLVERGQLEYGRPVSDYWPEFAQNGKEHVTVEQLISHQAGLVYLDDQWNILDPETDPEGMGRKLAAQKPHWTPGTNHGYHGITFGLYVDQLVRRADPDHRDVSTFFAEEIAEKFDLDVFLGLPLEENYRCARIYGANMFSLDIFHSSALPLLWRMMTSPQSITAKSMASPKEMQTRGIFNNPKIRTATNPSMMGYASATSLAKLMGIIAIGGSFGTEKLISPATIDQLGEVQVSGLDETLRINSTFGRGPFLWTSPAGNAVIGHPGAGGQMVYADRERQLGWAYITNYLTINMGDDPRYVALEKALYETYDDIMKKSRS